MNKDKHHSSAYILRYNQNLSRQNLQRQDTQWIKWHDFQAFPPGFCALKQQAGFCIWQTYAENQATNTTENLAKFHVPTVTANLKFPMSIHNFLNENFTFSLVCVSI